MYKNIQKQIPEQVKEIKGMYKENKIGWDSLGLKLNELYKTVRGSDNVVTILRDGLNDERKDLINGIDEFMEQIYRKDKENSIFVTDKDIESSYKNFIALCENYLDETTDPRTVKKEDIYENTEKGFEIAANVYDILQKQLKLIRNQEKISRLKENYEFAKSFYMNNSKKDLKLNDNLKYLNNYCGKKYVSLNLVKDSKKIEEINAQIIEKSLYLNNIINPNIRDIQKKLKAKNEIDNKKPNDFLKNEIDINYDSVYNSKQSFDPKTGLPSKSERKNRMNQNQISCELQKTETTFVDRFKKSKIGKLFCRGR
ncbi:MAG TPA: hypothetical protein VLL98_04095 [Rickettsiales bacterium]|nr:hypothetical protein [Rickettsiales bacterium]